jgi:RAMP superfamily
MKNTLFSNYDIKLKVLSPVHVGSGNVWQSGADFVLHDGHVCLLNRDTFYLDLDTNQQNRYLHLLRSARLSEVEKFILNETDFEAYIFQKILWTKGEIPKEIKAMMRGGASGNDVYIPGSSIKGAMASVFFNYLYREKNFKNFDKNISREVLGSFSNSIMRYFRPFDTSINATEVHQIDLFNLYKNVQGWRSAYKSNAFLLHLESLAYESEGHLRLSIADGLAHKIKNIDSSLLPKYLFDVLVEQPIDGLFSIINNYTRSHIERELEFFNAYPQAEDQDIIVETLEKILERTKDNSRSCVLRMASGSGFHSITGDWRFSDHRSTIDKPDAQNLVYNFVERQRMPARYKSRKITRQYSEVMGFVELSQK